MERQPFTPSKNDLATMQKREKIYENIVIIALSFCIIGFVSIFLGVLLAYWNINIWITILSVLILIIFLVKLCSERNKIKRIFPKYKPTRSVGYSIISMVCAIIPLIVLYYCLIVANGTKNENSNGAIGWVVVFYFWTAGIPLAIIWLVCGILGIKSRLSKLAIASLIIKPIGIIVNFLIILNQ